MKLTRTRAYKLNAGNYESIELSATVSVEGRDLFDDEELSEMGADDLQEALQKACEDYLDKMLKPDLKEAGALSSAERSILFNDPDRRMTTPTRRSKR